MTGEEIGDWNPGSPTHRRARDRAGSTFPRADSTRNPQQVARKTAINKADRATARQGTSIRVGEILGWRWWYVDGLLKSPFMDCTWFPDEPIEGNVGGGFGVYVMKDRSLAASEADKSLRFNSDGLWVWNNWRRRLPMAHTAYGAVHLWGEVIEHKAGYRAQFARVVSIEGLHPQDDELLAALRAKYGVTTSDHSFRDRKSIAIVVTTGAVE
jgi:hypothetical protein